MHRGSSEPVFAGGARFRRPRPSPGVHRVAAAGPQAGGAPRLGFFDLTCNEKSGHILAARRPSREVMDIVVSGIEFSVSRIFILGLVITAGPRSGRRHYGAPAIFIIGGSSPEHGRHPSSGIEWCAFGGIRPVS